MKPHLVFARRDTLSGAVAWHIEHAVAASRLQNVHFKHIHALLPCVDVCCDAALRALTWKFGFTFSRTVRATLGCGDASSSSTTRSASSKASRSTEPNSSSLSAIFSLFVKEISQSSRAWWPRHGDHARAYPARCEAVTRFHGQATRLTERKLPANRAMFPRDAEIVGYEEGKMSAHILQTPKDTWTILFGCR